ncbi:hypothetical protein SODG_001112 [Sodalis praecaptivus]|nr:hypothetical protein NVIRENTERO_00745 [Sodalis praecaptivus]
MRDGPPAPWGEWAPGRPERFPCVLDNSHDQRRIRATSHHHFTANDHFARFDLAIRGAAHRQINRLPSHLI